jgi:hypothetical protein
MSRILEEKKKNSQEAPDRRYKAVEILGEAQKLGQRPD